MTDQLEQYRRLARSMRFVPAFGNNLESSSSIVIPPIRGASSTGVRVTNHALTSEHLSPINPADHIAQLVTAAVSKSTTLPVVYVVPENMGDRISKLGHHQTTSHQDTVSTVNPWKIPAPDPNWIPPTPPVIEETVVSQTEVIEVNTPIETPVETPETSIETPVEVVVETPVETPETPIETPVEVVVETRVETTETPVETPVEAVVETPVETTETPVETPISSKTDKTTTTKTPAKRKTKTNSRKSKK